MRRFFIQHKKGIITSLLGLLFLCGMGSYFYFTMKEQTMNHKTGTLQSEAVQKMQEKEQFQQKSESKEKRQEADTTSKPDQTQLPTTIDKTKVDYSGKDVKPLTVEEMEKVDADNIISSFGVGTLFIPSIHMELPILEGVSQSNFLFVEYFLSSGESLDWLVKEIVNASLTVFEIEEGMKVYCKEWYDVIDKMEGLRLSVQGEKPSIEKTLRWLSNYLAPSLKMIRLIDLRLGTNELMERIDYAELKEKHEELIDQVCSSAKDLLFTTDRNNEVRSYMSQEFDLEEEYPF